MTIKLSARTILLAIVVLGIGIVLLGAAGVAGWEYSNSDTFCANACHQVHPEEPYSHQLSQHAQVSCVECHIGRLSTFEAMIEKSGHVAHAWAVFAGYERPITAPSLPPASASCESCHTSTTHQANSIRVRSRYATDENNTETKVTLIVRSVGRVFGGEPPRDVNWHASGAVRFIATDPQQLDIRWVEATRRDGEKVVYTDVKRPLGEEEIEQSERRVMDCIDCHNRAGHPFRNPELVVDEAFENNELSRSLPYLKARLVEVLNQEFETEEEAKEIVEQAWAKYQEDYPDLAEQYPDAWREAVEFTEERQDFMVELMVRSRFLEEEDVSWRSFPDHSGHKDAPGCFRCHSGRLQDASGNPIPVNCTNCHSVPLVTRRDRIPDNYLALLDQRKPSNHRRPDFMAKHMMLANERCSSCHGDLEYGTDDKTFCANSGCHDQSWQYVGWDALQTASTPEAL